MKLHIYPIKYTAACALFAATLLAANTSPVHAQTTPVDSLLNRTVVVEQEYNPDIMDARKINVVPEVEEIRVIPREVEYDNRMTPATTLPGEHISAYAAREVQNNTKRGYARLGYGMFGNLDAKASYLFTPGPKDKLGINFSMDGRDGKLWLINDEKWNNHFYRTRAALNYLHQFSKVDMDIAADFGLSNFNYLFDGDIGQKKYTSGSGHVGFASTDSELPVQFKAETNLMLYTRNLKNIESANFKETIVRTKADVTGNIGEVQQVGVALEMNNRFYGFEDDTDFTTLLLNPYYSIRGENWNVRLGVNVDLSFGFGDEIKVSPDVNAQYNFSDSYILYLKATGGRLSNDYRRLEQIDPFADFFGIQLEDSYRQLNGTLGFKASPVDGLWFNLYGGYENTRDDLFTTFFPVSDTGYTTMFYLTNSSNIYGGADINYQYKNIFSFNLAGKYQSWDSEMEYPSWLLPELTINAEIGVNPIEKLNISLGYEFIKHKSFDGMSNAPDVSNLSVGGSYEVFNGISIYARAYNLLNKKYHYNIGYIDQGASFLGGLSFRF